MRHRRAAPLFVAVALWGCGAPANELTDTQVDQTVPPDSEADVPTAPAEFEAITVATYNVQRFFDTTCDSGTCGAGHFEPSVSEDQFEAKARAITRGIEALDADFVLLQEVESQACLDALQDRLGGRYAVAYLGEIGVPGSVDVAVLAVGELLEVVLHRENEISRPRGGTTTFSRELPEVHIAYKGRRIVLLPLHFRSKYNDDPDRRLAEAEAARAIVADLVSVHPDAIILLGGDVNDFPGSPPMDALEAGDVLDAVYHDLAAHERWTHEYNSQQSMIDHLFIARHSGGQFVTGSARVVREDGGGLASSDHAGLAARVTSKPTVEAQP